jgi:hypothetical protein
MSEDLTTSGLEDGRQRPPSLSPVTRALRFAGDEVQLGNVLAAVCADSNVARAFCEAVLKRADGGNAAARRAVRRKHEPVSCLGEQRLEVRVSRRLAASRAKDAGRVDLRFGDRAGWLFAVELKLGATFGYKQLERYAGWGPVAAIVRDPLQVPDAPRLKVNSNWVGAATWKALLGDLRNLPVAPAWSSHWFALLDVVEADGDFDLGTPDPPEVRSQTQLLAALAQPVVDHLAETLRATYGKRATKATESLRHGPMGQGRAWSGFDVRADDGPWLYIGIRNLWSPHPRLRVDYYTYPKKDWRAARKLNDAHAKIQRKGFKPVRHYFRFEQPTELLTGATPGQPDAALHVIADLVTTLVRSRVFDVGIDRFDRGYY